MINKILKLNDLTLMQKIIYYMLLLIILIIHIILFCINIWLCLIPILLYIIGLIIIWFNNKLWARLVYQNIFIFGSKGSGKDLLMQIGIYLNRKKKNEFLSNVDYGYNCKVVTDLKKIMALGNNTYANLIENNIQKFKKNEYYEGKTFFLSDASIYFPSHEDVRLKKNYPSFPLFYAISRHLYDMPFVVNTQVNGRLWKSLREQVQDGYIKALKTLGFGWFWQCIPILRKYAVVKYRYYENETAAINGLLPFKKIAIVNKLSDKTIYMTSAGATEEMYNSSNGKIFDKFVVINKKKIKYDTRHFHQVFFGYAYNEKPEVENVKMD